MPGQMPPMQGQMTGPPMYTNNPDAPPLQPIHEKDMKLKNLEIESESSEEKDNH